MSTDVAQFGNQTVNLIYKILSVVANFVIVFCATWFNNDYTDIASKHTAEMRQHKAELEDGYIGDKFFTDEIEEAEDEHEDIPTV
jgi:hypothetical protein